ncbi:MAG TPA: hypothetical protein VFZ40_00190 [Pyrinomonadaceae bacterium]
MAAATVANLFVDKFSEGFQPSVDFSLLSRMNLEPQLDWNRGGTLLPSPYSSEKRV